MFEDIEYGGSEYKILGLDEILVATKDRIDWGYELKENWIVFAEIMGDI